MENHTRLHEIFNGEELKTAERIQHLRYLMLVHSRIYYKLNYNLISDKEFDALAKELKELQNANRGISEKVDFAEAFKDWDGSTGAFLPLDDEWVVRKTELVFSKGAGRRKAVEKQSEQPELLPEPDISPKPVAEISEEEDYQMSLADLFGDMEM